MDRVVAKLLRDGDEPRQFLQRFGLMLMDDAKQFAIAGRQEPGKGHGGRSQTVGAPGPGFSSPLAIRMERAFISSGSAIPTLSVVMARLDHQLWLFIIIQS
ncbi:hypothetical protein [Paracoccus sp. J56]|uniref:hypothetical protein n=1 Tax=Paracoccus sp. J56 TaxID=935850 RepID=UPI001F0B0DC0|nr:hypothetical protein [Paracoccus sp. J56]